MPSEADPGRSRTRRLHPASLLFSVGAQAKNLLVPGIVVLIFASQSSRGELWIMLLFIPAVVASLFRYWSYRYRFDRDELVVRQGIVFRSERHIPYARIQNIDLIQNPLHRLLRVAEVHLETAGGQKPEAIMRVLSLDAVRRMRSRVFADETRTEGAPRPGSERSVPQRSGPAAGSLYDMSWGDLLLFGLISNKGLVVVAAALGVAWQLDAFEGWMKALSRESFDRYGQLLPRDSLLAAALVGLAAIVLFLILVRALSIAWAIAKFHGFRLTRSGEDLRAVHGLLPRMSKTIPRGRIQLLSTREGFLHRRCGRVSVRVETAGSTGDGEGPSTDRLWLAPLIRKSRLAGLLQEVLPGVDPDRVPWQPISRRARGRRFRLALYLSLIVSVPIFWQLGVWGLAAPAVLVPLAWWSAKLYVRHTAYAVVPGAVFFRSGWWNRRLSVARFGKIQSLERGESPFDRRHGMASLRVDTAGASRAGHAIDIPYLDAAVATRLMGTLYEAAGRTTFRW